MRTAMLALALAAMAADWSRFRGPNGGGAVAEADVPVSWSAKEVTWKAALPGKGHSSPVVFGGKVFVTCSDAKGKRLVVCLALADGKRLWTDDTAGAKYKTHKKNSFASSTPAADERHVYVTWATPTESTITALSHAGKQVWSRDLGPYPSQHGWAVSPMLHAGLVVVMHQPDGDGKLIALDARSGEPRWSLPREGKNATYSTPCVFAPKGREPELILTNWRHGITGVEPATGKVAWERSVFDVESQQRCIPSPLVAGDLVIGSCGFAGGSKRLVAVRPGQGGKVEQAWRLDEGVPQMGTGVVVGDRLLLCNEEGVATWLDVKTGEVRWKRRVGGSFVASPVAVGRRVYCTSADGKVTVLAADDAYKVLATNELGEATQATPAVAGGRMLFRTEGHVICVGK